MHNIFEVLHLQKQKMFFLAAASLRRQKDGIGFLVAITFLLIKGTQGSTKPMFSDKQVCIAGGRALLQVEDCPKESVEKLRGEVDDEYSVPFTFQAQLDWLFINISGRPAMWPGRADLLLLPLADQQLHHQLHRRYRHHHL